MSKVTMKEILVIEIEEVTKETSKQLYLERVEYEELDDIQLERFSIRQMKILVIQQIFLSPRHAFLNI